VSVLLALALIALYWVRPLATEGITIWPAWIWALPGLVLVLDKPKKLWKSARWPLLAWVGLSVAFSEAWRVALPGGLGEHDVRVVTLNTGSRRVAGTMEQGMSETAALSPDIVLLQESAEFSDEDDIVRKHYGDEYEGVLGMDASIVVKGVILKSNTERPNFTFATVQLVDGRKLDVVSIRLRAPRVRVDYWTKECWQSYSSHRSGHLEQLQDIWNRVQPLRSGAPLVMGGDFNLVPDAGEVEILGSELVDSYRVAGRGWYATALEGARLFRIDKVWCSKELQPKGTFAHDSEPSDHRYVVAQFDWK
jgi:endonuclease/exonuclease/phosphatase (EEP) superfamily protein YafD